MNRRIFTLNPGSRRVTGTVLTLLVGTLTLFIALDVNPMTKGTFLASSAWAQGREPSTDARRPALQDKATSATTVKQEAIPGQDAVASAFQPDPLQSLAESLRLKERELAEREAALNKREKYVEALGLEVQQALAKIEQERRKMEAMATQADAERQKQLKKWIEIFQKMTPDKVAPALTGLAPDFQLQLLGQMDSAKAAKILNALPPDKAATISKQLAH
jgi:flagellar motility protein MotE (MotC chaperone)